MVAELADEILRLHSNVVDFKAGQNWGEGQIFNFVNAVILKIEKFNNAERGDSQETTCGLAMFAAMS